QYVETDAILVTRSHRQNIHMRIQEQCLLVAISVDRTKKSASTISNIRWPRAVHTQERQLRRCQETVAKTKTP
ncbi:MAG: hypothetical protein AAFQ89_18760, partial [Cyanobacteria bacterium J06626_18]